MIKILNIPILKRIIPSILIRFLKLIRKNRGYFKIKGVNMFLDFLDPIDRKIILYKEYEHDSVSFLDKGIEIVKIYLSVEKNIQKKRFEKRRNSPLIFWKFSENDLKVADRWDAFTFYKDQMFSSTSHVESPWVIINANTKMVAALNSLRYILEKFDYPEKNIPKPKIWSEGMNIYNLKINGVLFENLSYDQFKVLNSFADES